MKVTFSVRTNKAGSEVEETFTFEDLGIEQNLKGEELENAVEEAHKEWIWENIDTGYEIEEKITEFVLKEEHGNEIKDKGGIRILLVRVSYWGSVCIYSVHRL